MKISTSPGVREVVPSQAARYPCRAITGRIMLNAFRKAPNVKITTSAATSMRRLNRPMPERYGSVHSSAVGVRASSPMLSYGQAWTQSRQKVQSMFPALRGWNSASSQPHGAGLAGRPLRRPICPAVMQSLVRQPPHTAGRRTLISNGDISDPKKLNCPSGQICLQNAAPWKIVSTANTTPKYPTATQAVSHGLAHRLKTS